MDFLSAALQLTFYAVFVGTLWRAIRRPGPLEIAVAAVFGSMAAVFAYSLLNQLAPGSIGFLQPVTVVLLMLQPVLVFWLVHLVRPLPRWVLPMTFVAFLVAAAGMVLPPERITAAVVFVALYFMAAEGAAAMLLVRVAVSRYGIARLRLGSAALGTILFGAAIFIASIAAAMAGPGAESAPGALFVSRLSALLAALAYLAAFVPPVWLRRLGQRAVAFDVARSLVATSGDPGTIWRNLALAARDILGARRASVVTADGALVASTDEDDDSAAEDPSPAAPATLVDMPLPSASDGALRLRATIDGRPLFVDDDITIIGLLGAMTVRAVEREEAILRLADARHQLVAAQAVKASEARFRALLAAHPNAILAVDDGGTIIWATGTTAALFGVPDEELPGKPLERLIASEATTLADLAGEADVRRGHATARRADGSLFPADVAWTAFELDGDAYQLAVISDASWRQEANVMRDRFLGVLSHELRTPITSIYGGTQLLLKRGARLDVEERNELLGGVAAESERLQRIIENLLILARVERGADFFDRRPVALRPLLSELLDRERTLWPHMKVELRIEPGLPLVGGDEEYVTLIMRNLLSNAAKYAGGSPEVEVVVERGAEEVRVLVRDSGPGLRGEDGERLFSLYYRSAGSAPATPGAGIGLFVCRGLVMAMNGQIWAVERPEGGAEFGFSLPIYSEAGTETEGKAERRGETVTA